MTDKAYKSPVSETVLYMVTFTRSQMTFFMDTEYWKDGDFNERIQTAIVKGIEVIKAARS